MAFPAIDVLGVVPAPLLAARGGVARLAVDARRGPGRVGLLLRADLAAEQVVDRFERAVVSPLVEVSPDGALGGEILGEVTPLAAGPEDVEDGIDDVAQIGLARPSARMDGQVWFDQGPLGVGEIAGVGLGSHTSFYEARPLMGQTLSSWGAAVIWTSS